MSSTRLTSSRGRPPTSSRPISSRKGAGYSNGGLQTSGGKKVISPLEHIADSFSQFIKDTKDSPENKIKAFKTNISKAIQESSNLISQDNPQQALTKAKEAETEMKSLQDFITQKNIEEVDFKSVKYNVLMQLANAYKANSMYDDALLRYQRLLKDREFPHPQIAYLEIGNINMEQKKFEDAIKNYEMGINHLKPDTNSLIARFNQNCGIAQIQMGDYHKALSSFETAMRQSPSIKTGYNLVLCHSVLSSVDELKEAYTRMLAVKPLSSISDMNESDILGNQLHIERREQVRLVMLASRLVASKTTKNEFGVSNWQEMYEFVFQQLKKSKYPEAAGEFEIAYSLAYLNHKNANKAIEMLRQIRKKDPQLMALAATNLSFLYYLEQDYDNADKYANIALEHDKYNAQALVNKGNCLMQQGHEEEARDSYLEAIGVEADCVEALFNLGLVSKLIGAYDEAIQVLEKLNRIIPKCPEVIFELSDCYDKIGLVSNAIDWLHRLINILPTDPAVWRRLGSMWDRDGNQTQAFQCYSESFKYCPSDIEVISWLGSYFMHNHMYDNALNFFQRAAALAPKEPRYPLMVASCYRSMDCKQEALDVYERVIQMDPMNKQCLEHLIKLTTEMGITAKADYYQQLHAELLERIQEMQQEEQQRKYEEAEPEDLASKPLGLTSTTVNNPMNFTREKVDAPSLKVNQTGHNVTTAVAGDGKDDIWGDMDDIDIDL
ncbi:TPR Domain containing protein [Tritrichomonas foetus]|uniref:TPR Domain containing protein n=1 Tax=Tritrichomonas foetus TaxID=1144522 RepID=A0A1J4KY74_9EUKA|nr:TPR Domain containing protein [Tritrichomonas foetus]|eukprot:OHT16203.1 TPR Domain containing protein [Tritrichomonas foetus]